MVNKLETSASWPSWPTCTVYNEASDYGIPCGEVSFACQWVPLVKLLRPFKSGKCSNNGYGLFSGYKSHAWPVKIPIVGTVTMSVYAKAAGNQCSVNLPAGMLCGQLTSSCDLIPAMKAFVGFEEGECSADSYKLVPGATGPLVDGVTMSAYIDKSLDIPEVSGKTCSVYDTTLEFGVQLGIPCGEVAMDCALVPHAKLARETLKDGVCADAGYTVETDSFWARTVWVPLAGDIVTKVFDKSSVQEISV